MLNILSANFGVLFRGMNLAEVTFRIGCATWNSNPKRTLGCSKIFASFLTIFCVKSILMQDRQKIQKLFCYFIPVLWKLVNFDSTWGINCHWSDLNFLFRCFWMKNFDSLHLFYFFKKNWLIKRVFKTGFNT